MNKILYLSGVSICTLLLVFSFSTFKFTDMTKGWTSFTASISSSEWGNAYVSDEWYSPPISNNIPNYNINTSILSPEWGFENMINSAILPLKSASLIGSSGDTDTRKCAIILSNGYGSTGTFANSAQEIIKLATDNLNKEISSITVLPLSNFAATIGKKARTQAGSILQADANTKVLVAVHSIAAIGAFNYPYTGANSANVKYLLYDPPYATNPVSTLTPIWIALFPDIGFLGEISNGGQIKIAKNNGIASSADIINWTNGYAFRLVRNAENKEYNQKITENHEKFKNDLFALAKIYYWVKNNCPETKPVTCSGYEFTPWSPSPCPTSGKQTRSIIKKYPAGCDSSSAKLTRSCTPVIECTSFKYSPWIPDPCYTSKTQKRTIIEKYPEGCTVLEPKALSRNCPPPPPPTCTFTYSNWTPEDCSYYEDQTRTITGKYPSGCVGGTPGRLSRPCDDCGYGCHPPTFSDWSPCSATAVQPIGFRNRTSSCACVPYEELFEQCAYIIHAKPVIYLYPTQIERVRVQLDYKGKLIADYPEYNYDTNGWKVTAHPDGTIINSDGKEYSYIFWEGIPDKEIDYDLSKGFIVKGEDTVNFLQQTLSKMGLIPKEYNEFIVYWYPKMKDNAYNLIHFAEEEYTDIATLTITPKPDSMLRVFMVYKPLEEPVQIQEQDLKSFERKGFTVVEWGGAELK